jgi:RNA 2',3'-cyclic 3'-phosphodiesterase
VSGPPRRGDPYAGIPGRRLFVALALPDDALAEVTSVVDGVRALELPSGARDVRWVRMEGLHLTLRFLGPTPDARIEPTRVAVASAVTDAEPIEAELGGVGTFPPGPRPRTLWIGLTRGTEAITALAERVDAELVTAGWPSDPRPIRPHLTLARSDGVHVAPLVAERLAAALGERRIPLRLDTIGLYESVTGEGRARYLALERTRLG